MPRIRNWRDLVMCRPDRGVSYKHINRLFTDTADWHLIETHWQGSDADCAVDPGRQDFPRPCCYVNLALTAGATSSTAAQTLGSVIRTIFLLNWIGSRAAPGGHREHQQDRVPQRLLQVALFGGDVIAENDPDEQQKRLRYNDMVASSVILQNTVDMMRILQKLAREGWQFTDEDVSFLSPYLTSNVKRFGEFNLKLNRPPEPWIRIRYSNRLPARCESTRPVRPRPRRQYDRDCVSVFRVTPYGEVDIAALDRMRAGFDTSQLLRLVEGLDACLSEMGGITALRDELLKLHAMALTIVEGTAPAAPTENACIWAEAESVQLVRSAGDVGSLRSGLP